jgi:hypothetical protein
MFIYSYIAQARRNTRGRDLLEELRAALAATGVG